VVDDEQGFHEGVRAAGCAGSARALETDIIAAMNISDLIRGQARLRPEAVAMGGPKRRLTYAELDASAGHVAERLGALGVAPGELVGVAMRSAPFHMIVILALARLGAISVPVPPGEVAAKREQIARRFGLTAIVSANRSNEVKDVPLLLADPAWMRPPQGFRARDPAPGDDAPWRIVLTSGTTGIPKGVALTHARSAALFDCYKDVLPFGPGDRLLCVKGLGDGFMLRYALHVLLGGGTLVFDTAPKLADFIEVIERRKLTHAIVSPAYLQTLVRSLPAGKPRLPGLANLSVGGGVLSTAVSSLAQERVTPNVYNSHGAAETGLTALADPAMLRASPEYTGRVVPWVEAQAVDESDKALAAGKSGILRYRSRFFPDAYFKDPGASASRFRDGWFYPGDVGSVERGLLRVEARSDDLINLGGMKVLPAEVESVLAEHPGVSDAAAFEGRTPGGDRKLFAAVVTSGAVPEAELMAFCRTRLGTRAPEKIYKVERLPRNEAGKLLRREIAGLVR
jgi:acyl-coenzyme A synthetase/AMP-(fatty) acid ligase